MSTRCQILFEAVSVTVYRHSDGYPDGEYGVLAGLLPVVRWFDKYRGWEPEMLVAHVVHRFVADHHRDRDDRVSRGGRDFPELRVAGFGVEPFDGELHGDLDYVYIVRPDHVEVRTPNRGFWDESTLARTRLDRRVDFSNAPYVVTSGRRKAAARREAADPDAYAVTKVPGRSRPQKDDSPRRVIRV